MIKKEYEMRINNDDLGEYDIDPTIESYFWSDCSSTRAIFYDIISLLKKVDTFSIPLYQRNYVWGEVEISQLIKDIIKNKNHYLGQILLHPKKANKTFNVIDGQQRLTTLIKIIGWILHNFPKAAELDMNIIYSSNSAETKMKSKVKYGEDKNLILDFENPDDDLEKFNLIMENIIKDFGNAKKVIDNLSNNSNLTIVKFEEESNEYILFEKVNSTGVPLSIKDLIRNYILKEMKEKSLENKKLNEVDIYFTNTFTKEIESEDNSFSGKEERFFKTFIAYYCNKKVDEQKQNRMYFLIKEKNGNSFDPELFFKDIKDFLEYSKKLENWNKKTIIRGDSANRLSIFKLIYKNNKNFILPILYWLKKINRDFDFSTSNSKDFKKLLNRIAFIASFKYIVNNNSKVNDNILYTKKSEKFTESIEEIYNSLIIKDEEMIKFKENFINSDVNYYDSEEYIDFKKYFKYLMAYLNNNLKWNGTKKHKQYEINLENLHNYSIEHIIPKNYKDNEKWSNLFIESNEDVEKLLNSVSNYIILENDYSGNDFILKKISDNYSKENSMLIINFTNEINNLKINDQKSLNDLEKNKIIDIIKKYTVNVLSRIDEVVNVEINKK